jgi:hypothetical protein
MIGNVRCRLDVHIHAAGHKPSVMNDGSGVTLGTQHAVEEFLALGRLPDSESATVEALQRFEEVFRRIRRPLTDDEARALTNCFGADDCFGLAWSLLHAIETAPGWPLVDALQEARNDWIATLRQRASL